jgi:hypothetical protein
MRAFSCAPDFIRAQPARESPAGKALSTRHDFRFPAIAELQVMEVYDYFARGL